MQVPENTLKTALLSGKTQHGVWLGSATTVLAEIAGGAGFDWCLIDGEHGPNTIPQMLTQLQVLAGTGTPAVVRIPSAEAWMVKQVLDIGAQTVVVPMVDDGQKAQKMARAMRYAPLGNRGMGAALARASRYDAMPNYVHDANAQMCLFVQAESAAAVANIDAIATTDGVDGIFIGPADLSADMGYPGRADHPEVTKAINHLIARTKAAGKIVATITTDNDQRMRYEKAGITCIAVGVDVMMLGASLRQLAASVKAV